jgi:hypothetical protein
VKEIEKEKEIRKERKNDEKKEKKKEKGKKKEIIEIEKEKERKKGERKKEKRKKENSAQTVDVLFNSKCTMVHTRIFMCAGPTQQQHPHWPQQPQKQVLDMAYCLLFFYCSFTLV